MQINCGFLLFKLGELSKNLEFYLLINNPSLKNYGGLNTLNRLSLFC